VKKVILIAIIGLTVFSSFAGEKDRPRRSFDLAKELGCLECHQMKQAEQSEFGLKGSSMQRGPSIFEMAKKHNWNPADEEKLVKTIQFKGPKYDRNYKFSMLEYSHLGKWSDTDAIQLAKWVLNATDNNVIHNVAYRQCPIYQINKKYDDCHDEK
jgi:cytochrome c551/c552